MKIFLSYSSRDTPVAKDINLALEGSGHQVFFDKSSLPPAGDYHARIRSGVDDSDAVVFLISPDSVKRGCYALTELKFAQNDSTRARDPIATRVQGRLQRHPDEGGVTVIRFSRAASRIFSFLS